MFTEHGTIYNILWIAAIAFLIFLTAVLFFAAPEKVAERPETSKEKANMFGGLDIEARAALVWDIERSTALYEKNADAQLPLASLTKVMTAVLAKEAIEEGDTVVVEREAVEREGDSGLLVGERWSVDDLVGLTLLASSNDGAAALASAAALRALATTTSPQKEEETVRALMNEKARELKMAQTFFVNASGLDASEGISGAYGSAHDFASLLSYALHTHPGIFEPTAYPERTFISLSGEEHKVENTHETIEKLPSVIASKTGFTDLAGGNLAVIFEAGPMRPIAVIVLGSTAEGRFTDVQKLIWAAIHSLFQKG